MKEQPAKVVEIYFIQRQGDKHRSLAFHPVTPEWVKLVCLANCSIIVDIPPNISIAQRSSSWYAVDYVIGTKIIFIWIYAKLSLVGWTVGDCCSVVWFCWSFSLLCFCQVLNSLCNRVYFFHLKALKINCCFRQVTTPETAEFNTIITRICILLHFSGKYNHYYCTIFANFVSW